jgi:osmotically-inducible protein OsmY
VRAALRQDPRTSKLQIAVTAEDGIVTFTGLIDESQQAKDAAEVARLIPGVRDAVTELRVATERVRHIVE